MQASKLLVAIGIGLLSVSASADQYVNGWTESTFRSAVNGCVASAVPRQMQFMFDSGQLKKGATPAEVEAARTRVNTVFTAICTCAQQRIMRDVKFEDVAGIRQRPEYARQVMSECSAQTMQKRN